MGEETEFAIGATVSCSDGVCGVVRRIIVDPHNWTVTHLVIKPKHRQYGRLAPVDLVDTTTGEIRLHCAIAEFDQLEPAEEAQLVEGAGLGVGTAVGGTPLGVPQPTPVVVEDVIPADETEVAPGDPVYALDGEIGQVRGFLVHPDDRRVTYVLLREGHLWGRKEVAIPISAVAGADAEIRVNLTKKQIEDLPPAG